MKTWKAIIHYMGNIQEIKIEASSYSDAYIKAESYYPGCVVKNISEIRLAHHGSNHRI